jgi:integrase
MAKGTIKIEVFKDRLRLRWSTNGDRFCIYIGLPDTKINRSAAEAKKFDKLS